jgi:protein SCO1/2
VTARGATDGAAPGAGQRHDSLPVRLLAAGALLFVALIGIRALGEAAGPPGRTESGGVVTSPSAAASPSPTVDPTAFLDPFPRPAPALELTGPGGAPVALTDYLGAPVLVFFGYTHCPDVCPVTIGAVGEAIDAFGGDAQAIFVSVDPERDTIPWLAEFVKYMPAGFTGVTGTPEEVRTTADAWGVRYAKVETDDPDAYQMAHTADVFVVDGAGQFRARLPFGTEATTMAAVLREVVATTVQRPASAPPTGAPPTSAPSAPSPVPTTSPAADLTVEVVSSSVWAGGASPVILRLAAAGVALDDPTLAVTVGVLGAAGVAAGPAVTATAVEPEGVDEVSFVAVVDIPTPGGWTLAVTATDATGAVRAGTASVEARDPGGTAALGVPAPRIRTPTAGDFDGDLTWVTTDPAPDPRLTATSTADALAAGEMFVFVVDSYTFKVTPACGKAVVMAKQLVYRWPDVPFIHHEPYRYTVVAQSPQLEGTLQHPFLTDAAEAWGVGSEPWGVGSMPWLFVVDRDGIVRAKYQGVMGSADVDVMLTLLARETTGAG